MIESLQLTTKIRRIKDMETKIYFHFNEEGIGHERIDISLKDIPMENLGSVLKQLPDSLARAYGAETRLLYSGSVGKTDTGSYNPEEFMLQNCIE